MIVLEGTPGAGKSTLLGSIIERQPDQVVVFPEAQPAEGETDEDEIAARLLAEDQERIELADAIESKGLSVLTDRCYVGVLAYRYALWQSGRLSRGPFDRARRVCSLLDLPRRYSRSAVYVLLASPQMSIERRRRYGDRPEFSTWFDSDFLEAYNAYLLSAPSELPDRTVIVEDGAPLWDLLAGPTAPGRMCPKCRSEPRSAVVESRGSMIQLFARGLHIEADGDVVCANTAQELLAVPGLLPGQ